MHTKANRRPNFERLESRTLLNVDTAPHLPYDLLAIDQDVSLLPKAAETNTPSEAAPVPSLLSLRLLTTDAHGQQIDEVSVGESFQLEIWVSDLRQYAQGVFSAHADLTFDAEMAFATEIRHGEDYGYGGVPNPFLAETIDDVADEAGLLDEVGSFSASIRPLGPRARQLLSVEMLTTAAGELTFTSDPADNGLVYESGLYGRDGAVPADRIEFGTITISVVEAATTSQPWRQFFPEPALSAGLKAPVEVTRSVVTGKTVLAAPSSPIQWPPWQTVSTGASQAEQTVGDGSCSRSHGSAGSVTGGASLVDSLDLETTSSLVTRAERGSK